MTELIGNWLMNSVGCNIRCTPETLGEACFNGKLFAQILCVYNICSTEYLKLIDETNNPLVAMMNLKKLCVWFKLLGIEITDELLNGIVNKSGSACLKLLYELFIRLENRESMYYIDAKKMKRLLSASTDKFQVVPAPEKVPIPEEVNEKQYLLDILSGLRGNMDAVEQATLRRFLKDCRERHTARITKEIIEDEPCSSRFIIRPCEELEAKAKINEFEAFLVSQEKINNVDESMLSPREYISCLRLKRRKMEADKKLKQKLGTVAMQDAWRQMLIDQEKELKDILAKKLLKQSEHEKQMTLRLKRMRDRYKMFVDNRNMIMDIAHKQESINHFKNTFSAIKVSERISVEKQRVNELHQRLFREKMRLKRIEDYKACRIILEDIVDYAMIKQDYLKNNRIPIPKEKINELKVLFIKGVRLLAHEIIPKRELEPFEPPIRLDDVRIQELAEIEFHQYLYRTGPWFIYQRPEEEHENLNVTGFIVHRLLDLKYNFNLSIGEKADLPNYEYKVLLHNMNNLLGIDKLRHHLSNFKVEVIDVITVTNYFLNIYKTYTGIDAIKQKSETVSYLKSRQSLSLASKDKKLRTRSTMSTRSRILKDRLDKSIQVPSTEELENDKVMPEAVMKGKCVYEILQKGCLLSDSLICSLIIDYLKTLKDINGWVLVNYPQNITQIAILEFMFTGLQVPFMPKVTDNIRKLIASELNSALKNTQWDGNGPDPVLFQKYVYEDIDAPEPGLYSIEELIKLKNSNILPKPNAPSAIPEFHSFFTKVIVLNRDAEIKKPSPKKTLGPPSNTKIEGENGESKLKLETFYKSLGIQSNFHYDRFDLTTSKKLIRFVLSVSSDVQQEFYKTLDKGVNILEKPEEQARNTFASKASIIKSKEEEWIETMFLQRKEEESVEEPVGEEGLEQDVGIYPGDIDWVYTQCPISQVYVNILATIWESIEYFYITNLKECFGLLRTTQNRLMPYRNYIWTKAEECLNLLDDRTKAVTNFQLMLNGIESHYRSIDTMKNELHYRLLKLQCNLWKMTDIKKFYCDQVLELIRRQKWISGHSLNLLKVYNFILQVEADRFVETMQLIEDYYSICLLGYALDDRLRKLIFPKIGMEVDKLDENLNRINRGQKPGSVSSTTTRKNRLSLIPRTVKNRSQDNLMDPFNELRGNLYYTDFENEIDPIGSMLQTLTSRLKKAIFQKKNRCLARCESIIADFKDFARVVAGRENLMNKSDNTSMSVQNIPDVPALKSLENAVDKITLEWNVAIENESQRILYRIGLIEARFIADINEDTSVIENTFSDFGRDIVALYHRQTLNIDKVCDLMRAAIEEETAIQPLVLLKNDALEIDGSVILFPEPPPPPPPSLREVPIDCQFSITQLNNFFSKMIHVAPLGIVERSFVQILEDMACMGHETGHCYLPYVWSCLTSHQIKDVVHRLFGQKPIIDWRLFIVFALDLGYPTLENILEMRQCFRQLDTNLTEVVNYEQYSCVFLWFEGNESLNFVEDLYHAKAKEILFKIFQISENLMNYTEFLLAFCRDHYPVEGFVKALALVEGCATVAWKQDLFRETLQIENENEKYNIAFGILTILMAGVFRIVDNVIITEVVDSDHEIQEPGVPKATRTPSRRKTYKGKMKRTQRKSLQLNMEQEISKSNFSECTIDVASEKSLTLLNIEDEVKPRILWKSDVYFSTVFSILLLDIHNFSLHSDQVYEPLDMEENLLKIFNKKGNGHSMKLFKLLSDFYIKDLFSKYKCFQAIGLTNLIAKILNRN